MFNNNSMTTTTIKTSHDTSTAKRYTRLAHPPNIQLTKRFIEVNASICRHGMVTFEQLRALHPDIPCAALYPITRLSFHNGFSNRPYQQEAAHKRVPGRLSTFITPDRKGVQLHSAFFADPVPIPKYTYQPPPQSWLAHQHLHSEPDQPINWEAWLNEQDRHQMTWGYMRHQHTTTSTLLHYRCGATGHPDITFFTEADLWNRYAPDAKLNKPIFDINDFPTLMARDFVTNPPEGIAAPAAKTPLQLKTRIDWLVKLPGNSGLTEHTIPISTQPDGYFAHQLATNKLSFFFLESDEGTETILPGADLRRSLQLFSQTSLLQKYLTYIAAFRSRAHQKQFGIPAFKVITVTSTPKRVDDIIDKMGDQHAQLKRLFNIHSNFLLFTDHETLARYNNNPYHPDYIHLNLDGEYVHLTEV
ncbi:MAG: hypothetical protein K0U74_12060 [Alphaproteobacteria bacterium]|nr:hypothetical protein [Alphaproteobacteria bacterium]